MERSEPNDDELYPRAPLPAHERGWRHPSELGQAAWVHTEPPLAIGRGLTVTTGAIGGLLAVAVLWAMLPGAGDPAVTAQSTSIPSEPVASLSAAVSPTTTAVASTIGSTTSTLVVDPATTIGTIAGPRTGSSLPGSREPVPTMQVGPAGVDEQPMAVAVAITDTGLVITTARAVGDDDLIRLASPDGTLTEAEVLFVDTRSGLAVLSVDSAPAAFSLAGAASIGDVVTVLSLDPLSSEIQQTDNGQLMLVSVDDETEVAEGTPVVNAEGKLVGLCSRGERGAELVVVGDTKALQAALNAFSGLSPWIGVTVANAGPATITAVEVGSPAATAGLVAGDVITSVEGVAIASATELAIVLQGYLPGTTVVIQVAHANGTVAELPISLASRSTSL